MAKNINVRLGEEESEMIEVLRKKYYINISEYLRATIRHLYQSKTKDTKGNKQ